MARRFVLGFLLVYMLALCGLLPSLHYNVFYGDLTRVGHLPESKFGWHFPQPSIALADLQSTPLAQADVLVIGDSFSIQRRWQSVLTGQGNKVHTVSWGELGDSLCNDRINWLIKQGLRRDSIIIAQSVQRDLLLRVARSLECPQSRNLAPLPMVSRPVAAPLVVPPVEWFNPNGNLFVGLNTLLNSQRLQSCQDCVVRPWRASNGVRIAGVPNGCSYFSHQSCDQALFLQDDRLRLPLDLALVNEMAIVSKRIERARLIWLVVPDKTEVYLGEGATFWAALEMAGLGPDLFSALRLARETVRDLYPGNESHLSNAGFLLLGRLTAEFMNRAPAQRSVPR